MTISLDFIEDSLLSLAISSSIRITMNEILTDVIPA